uniref:ubiquitinyl hydrolase 1 n=1 Tax=Cyclopterus lumpus TaxID=8103 RepID=A0A8C2XSH0_CYCLU
MNSILQVLSHLQKFRECFLTLDLCETEELLAKTNNSQEMKGVTGGVVSSANTALSGCPLGRMGKPGSWNLAPVSPFAMLHSVWNLIPAFRGYDQQDAQEFLCELLDKVQQELDTEGSKRRIVIPITQRKLSKQVLKVLNTIFHGQLLSQVTCLSCKHKSNTVEPFWDLSLEFPERYHSIDKGSGSTAYQRSCTLTEMLSKFTEMEALEGSIYACNHCNKAHKQLLIYPDLSHKIGVHVAFDQVLNIKPYCCTGSGHSVHRGGYTYDLSAVVMHHGKGFGSGHYTAYLNRNIFCLFCSHSMFHFHKNM